jgi:hypothetical protein
MLPGVIRAGPFEWELPIGYVPGMRVPGRFYLSDALAGTLEEGAIRQLANVATLPGILCCSLAMPDIHWGYGFPIGGVAAFDLTEGVVSPGGVGFDINCGVRLLATPLREADLGRKAELVEDLYRAVPTGVGARTRQRLTTADLRGMLEDGAAFAVRQGLGVERDLDRCEGRGRMDEADPSKVSEKALLRGLPQSGTLGAGNHFLELQVVDEVYDPAAAAAFGVEAGTVGVMIHCGSRGLGHQVCTDYIAALEAATKRYGFTLPDRQLACAPIGSPEGQAYLGAMRAALARIADASPETLIWVDSRMRPEHFRRVIVKPNQHEAEAASVRALGRVDYDAFRRHIEAPLLVITHGGEGALVVDENGAAWARSRPVENPVDICGAGDSFSAGAALALKVSRNAVQAAQFGNMVASITIMKKGTGTASPEELLAADR